MNIPTNKPSRPENVQTSGAHPKTAHRPIAPSGKRTTDRVVAASAAAVNAPPVAAASAALETPKAAVKKTPAQAMPTIALDDAEKLTTASFQSLDANQRGTRAPDIAPATSVKDTNGSTLTAYTATAGLGNNADAPTLAADRQEILLAENLHIGGHTDSIFGGTAGGVNMVGATIQETNDLTTNPLMLGTPDFLAPVIVQKFHVAGMSAQAGAALIVTGRAGIKAIDEKPGFVQLEQQRKRTIGAVVMGGISNGTVGLAARLTAVRDKEAVLRRWVKPDVAAELLHKQDQGLRTYGRNTAVALGLAKPLMKFPKLSETKSFQLHDEMICTVRGALTGTLALASNVLLTGVEYTRSGEFELVVHRTRDEAKDGRESLNVVIAPKKVSHALAAFIDVPILADIRSVLAKSAGARHGYTFALDDPEAVLAYHQLLAGKLPGAAVVLDGIGLDDVAGLVTALKEESLPSGVARLFTEHVELDATSHSAALTLPRYLPFLGWAGISMERRATRSRHIIGAQGSAVATEADTVLYETQRMHMGTQTEASSVKAQRVSSSDSSTSSVEGVIVGASYTVDRTRGKNRDHLAKALNETFLHERKVPSFEPGKANLEQSYKLSLERTIRSEDIAHLTKLAGQDEVMQKATPAIRGLLPDLAAIGEEGVLRPELTTPAFARYARRTGVSGLGELHKFLGNDAHLSVQPESSADKDVSASKLELGTKYHKPMEPLVQSSSDLNKRVVQVSRALKRADRSESDLLRDPLLKAFDPKARDATLKKVKEDKQIIRKLVDTEHLGELGRVALDKKLSTKSKQRLDAVLQPSKQGKKL